MDRNRTRIVAVFLIGCLTTDPAFAQIFLTPSTTFGAAASRVNALLFSEALAARLTQRRDPPWDLTASIATSITRQITGIQRSIGADRRVSINPAAAIIFLQAPGGTSSPLAIKATLVYIFYAASTMVMRRIPFSTRPKLARLVRIYLSPIVSGILGSIVFATFWAPTIRLGAWRRFDPELLIGLGIMNGLALLLAVSHISLNVITRHGDDLRRTLVRLQKLEQREAAYLLPRLKNIPNGVSPDQAKSFADSVRLVRPFYVFFQIVAFALPIFSVIQAFHSIQGMGIVAPLLLVMGVIFLSGFLTEKFFNASFGFNWAWRIWIRSLPGTKRSTERFVLIHETTHAILDEYSMPNAVMALRMAELLGKSAGHALSPIERLDRMAAAFPAVLDEAGRAQVKEGFSAMEQALRGDRGWETPVEQIKARPTDLRDFSGENYSWSLRIGGMAIALLDHFSPAPDDLTGGIPWAFIRGLDVHVDPRPTMAWLASRYPALPQNWLTPAPTEHSHRSRYPGSAA